jgi:hypothetical protein
MKPLRSRTFALSGLLLACVAASARAEVEQVTQPGGQYVPAMALPKLPHVAGWVLSPSACLAERARVLLPAGKTLATTNAQITAMAYAKSVLTPGATLDEFVAAVQANDQKDDPDRIATPAAALTDKTGQVLRAFTFKGAEGAVGEALYGSETSGGATYFTVFTLSARDAVAFSDSIASFRNVIAAYQ